MKNKYDDAAISLTIGALFGAWAFYENGVLGLALAVGGYWFLPLLSRVWPLLPVWGREEEGSVSSRGKR